MLSVSRQEHLVENKETLPCTGTVCRVYQDKNTLWRITRSYHVQVLYVECIKTRTPCGE